MFKFCKHWIDILLLEQDKHVEDFDTLSEMSCRIVLIVQDADAHSFNIALTITVVNGMRALRLLTKCVSYTNALNNCFCAIVQRSITELRFLRIWLM